MAPKNANSRRNDWKWVILVAAFVSNMANAPISYAFGTFVLPWKREFAAQGAVIALITSFGSSISSIGCPVGSFLVQKWGYRWTHVIGGILIAISFATSSFVQSLLQMFVTYSILGGVGSALCLVSFVNALTEHFSKHRGVAFAIVTSAYGIGGFVFPLFFQSLIDEFTWRGAMLVTSPVLANIIACGLLMYSRGESPPIPEFCCCGGEKAKSENVVPLDDRASQQEGTGLEETRKDGNRNPTKPSGWACAYACYGRMKRKPRARSNRDDESSLKSAEEDDVIVENGSKAEQRKATFWEVSKILLSTSTFYIFVLHNIASYMGYFMVFGLTPLRASEDYGMSDSQASMLVATFGISQMICRLALGFVVDLKLMKISTIYILSYYFAGIAALVSLLANTFEYQIAYCALASATYATHAFYPLVVHQVYDKDLFNVAFGFLEIMHGVGTVIGPLVGGLIYDATGTCQYSFVFAGISIIFSISILLAGLGVTKQFHKLVNA